MKFYMLIIVLAASCLMVSGELSEDDLDNFENVEIFGTRIDTWKNDDREKYEVVQVTTSQSQDDPFNYNMGDFRIRLVVELADKEKNKYIVQFTGTAATEYDDNYDGEDVWRLYMAHGDLERLKISGFVAQYGFMDGETFVLLTAETDHEEDILAGLKARTTRQFPGTVYLRHYYMYDDDFEGLTESIPMNVLPVKE